MANFDNKSKESPTKEISTIFDRMDRPLPKNFEKYLPWASKQFKLPVDIVVTKTKQDKYIRMRSTEKLKTRGKGKSRITVECTEKDDTPVISKQDQTNIYLQTSNTLEKAVHVVATYDTAGNLVKIKLGGNLPIPRELFKILTLIVKFYPYLTEITMNDRLTFGLLHEMQKLLSVSCITDLCLDNTFVKEGNYHVLLETASNIKYLSLARCSINDTVVGNIAAYLQYPCPASKTLSILNLSSNYITDLGAKHLGEALRSNRKLSYLNLSDNEVTDEGAICLLDALVDFTLTNEEVFDFKHRYLQYLRGKNEILSKIFKELKQNYLEFKSKKLAMKSPPPNLEENIKSVQNETLGRNVGPITSVSSEVLLEKQAKIMAETITGPFKDPFSTNNTYVKDELTHCFGNNTLCYLNLAYNSLTYLSLKKIRDVIIVQKMLDMNPRGLINVCIKGNPMPKTCVEMLELNDLLEAGLIEGTQLQIKRKYMSKTRNM